MQAPHGPSAARSLAREKDNDETKTLESGAPEAPLAPLSLELLIARVTRAYGAFGVWGPKASARAWHEEPVASSLRPYVRILGVVLASSLALSRVSHPEWSAPGEWSSAFRPDMLFIVVWAPIVAWAMTRWSLARSVLAYLTLSLFIDSFSEVMMVHKGGGYWDSIMWPASVAWFGTIKELTGLPGASVSVFTLVTVGLMIRARFPGNGHEAARYANLVRERWTLFACALALLWGIGLARGGSVIGAFRQTQHVLQLPWIGLVVAAAIRTPRDLRALGQIVVACAVARSLLVAWVYVGVCVRNGVTELPGHPEWCTTHSDTVLFVTALGILVASRMERERRPRDLRGLWLGAIVLGAIFLNNRRLAFVSLALMLAVMWMVLAPSPRTRRVAWGLGILGPLVGMYLIVGASVPSESLWFRPAKSIASVLEQHDASSVSRDIENGNLVFSLAKSPLVPQGFGHEYDFSPETPPVDLSDVFASYRLVAHNGVLWLWSVGGVAGFTLVWLLFPTTIALACYAYRTVETPLERVAALSSLGAIVVCIVQVWGDQGLSSYVTMVTIAVSGAVAASLAVRGECSASWRLCEGED